MKRRGVVATLPAFALFLTSVLLPTIAALAFAFTEKRIGTPIGRPTVNNVFRALQEPLLASAIWRTLLFAIAAVSLKLSIAYLIAALIDGSGRIGRMAARLLLLPWLIPGALASLLWVWLLFQPGGVIDHIGRFVLGHPIPSDLLGSTSGAFAALVSLNVWREAPFWALVLYAARLRVPQQLRYEMALSGATRLDSERQLYWHFCAPAFFVSAMLSVALTFGELQSVQLITRGGPSNATRLLASLAYDVGYGGGIGHRHGRFHQCRHGDSPG